MVTTFTPKRTNLRPSGLRLKTSPNPDKHKIIDLSSSSNGSRINTSGTIGLKTSPTPQRKPTPSRKNPGHPQFSRQHPQRQSPRRLFASFQDTLNTATLRPCRRLGGVCPKVDSSRCFGSLNRVRVLTTPGSNPVFEPRGFWSTFRLPIRPFWQKRLYLCTT